MLSTLITYEEYLFAQLLNINHTPFARLPYDAQFERVQSLYQNFYKSDYNDNSKPMYECMQEYIDTRNKEFLK